MIVSQFTCRGKVYDIVPPLTFTVTFVPWPENPRYDYYAAHNNDVDIYAGCDTLDAVPREIDAALDLMYADCLAGERDADDLAFLRRCVERQA